MGVDRREKQQTPVDFLLLRMADVFLFLNLLLLESSATELS